MIDPLTMRNPLKVMRNGALEEAARIAERVAEANLDHKADDSATVGSSVAQVIANKIRELKS